MSKGDRANLERLLRRAWEMQGRNQAEQMQSPSNKIMRRQKHPALAWCTGIGLASIFLGALGLMSLYYWPSVVLCYVGLSLLFIDASFHPELTKWRRATFLIVIAILCAGFTFGFVLAPAPINFWATSFAGEYPSGVAVSGIPWSKKYVELQIFIDNPTRFDYEELNLIVRPDKPVVAVAQMSEYPKAIFQDAKDNRMHMEDIASATGERKAIPLILIATDSGCRVRCERLPAHSNITTKAETD